MKLKLPDKRGWIFAAVTGAIALLIQFVPHETHHSWWEVIPGWWAWFGAIGCAVIVLVSKFIGKVFLQKPEDWYE